MPTASWKRFSSDWSRKRASRYCQVVSADKLNMDRFAKLNAVVEWLILEPFSTALNIEPIAGFRQSSFHMENVTRGQNVLLFDVLQSITLRSLALHLIEGRNYADSALLLKSCGSLAVHEHSPEYAEHIDSCEISQLGHHYLTSMEALGHSALGMAGISGELVESDVLNLVDTFVFAHEYYHYLEARGPKATSEYKRQARASLNAAVPIVTFFDKPDFEDRATYGGMLSIGKNGLKAIRSQQRLWRKHYLGDGKKYLLSEIAADSYAFATVIGQLWNKVGGVSSELYFRWVRVAYLIMVMWDLHLAMIRRAVLSLTHGVRATKPGNMGESNLRKAALTIFAQQYPKIAFSKKLRSSKAVAQLFGVRWSEEIISPVKLATDVWLVLPASRAIVETLEKAESGEVRKSASTPSELRVPDWFDPIKVYDAPRTEELLGY